MKEPKKLLSVYLSVLMVLTMFITLTSVVSVTFALETTSNTLSIEDAQVANTHQEQRHESSDIHKTICSGDSFLVLSCSKTLSSLDYTRVNPFSIFPGDDDPDPTPGDGEGDDDEGGEGDEYDPDDPESEGHKSVTKDENGNVSSWVDQDGVLHVNNTDENGNVPVDSNGDPEYSEATGDERVASWGRILDSIDEGNTTIENNTGMPIGVAMKTGDDEYSGYNHDGDVGFTTYQGVSAEDLVGPEYAGELNDLDVGGSVFREFLGILKDGEEITYVWSFQANKSNGDILWGTSALFNPPDIILVYVEDEYGNYYFNVYWVVCPCTQE